MRSTSRALIALLAIVLVTTITTQPAAAESILEADRTEIDFGTVIGSSPVETVRIGRVAGSATMEGADTGGPFEIVQNLCADSTFGTGQSCVVRVRVADNAPLGSATGTLTVWDDFAGIVTVDLKATVATAAIAFDGPGGGDFEGDGPWMFTPNNSDLSASGSRYEFGISATRGGTTYGFDLRVVGRRLRPEVIDADFRRNLPYDYIVFSIDRSVCETRGRVRVLEVNHDADDVVTHFRAQFEVCGNTKGIIVFDAEERPDEMIFGPTGIDLGPVDDSHERLTVFGINLTEDAVPVHWVNLALDGFEDLGGNCHQEVIAAGNGCQIRLRTDGSYQDQPLQAVVRANAGGEISTVVANGQQVVTRLLVFYPSQYFGERRLININTFNDPGMSAHRNPHGGISFQGANRQRRFDIEAGGLIPGEWQIRSAGLDGPGTIRANLSSTCIGDGSTMNAPDVRWPETDGTTAFMASFQIQACGGGLQAIGLASHNSDIGTALIVPDWIDYDFGTFSPTRNRKTVRLTNSGDAPGVVTLEFDVNREAAFYLEEGQCQRVVLAPGEHCDQEIVFAPMSRSGELLWSTIEIGGNHLLSGLQLGVAGGVKLDWPVTAAAQRAPEDGYWLLHDDGTVTGFGDARFASGNIDGRAVDIVPTPSGRGYWLLTASGEVIPGGDARIHGQVSYPFRQTMDPSERFVSMSATPSGLGYWVFTSRGRVFAFGDAPEVGDLLDVDLASSIVDSVATPSGQGIYMIGTDGGVFALGDAQFAGSVPQVLPGVTLDQPVVGIVPDPDGVGYWLVAADGGVFGFEARFVGSVPQVLPPGVPLDQPVNGMVSYGDGYLLVAADGGVFNFSSKPFAGSLGGQTISSPVVAIAPMP